MFSYFLNSLGAKNSVKKKKNVLFDASQAQNHGSCGVFLLLEPKTQHLAKTVVFTQFSACCRRTFARPNAQKHRKLQCFGIWNPMKTVKNHQQAKAEKWSNRWCFVFFEHSRSKKLCKNRVFLTPRRPKTTVFAVFFAPGTKNHGIYSVLWPEPSKNSGIYAVFSMLQDVLLPGQTQKNTVNIRKLQCFGVWNPMKTVENHQQVSKMEHLVRAQKTRQTAGRFLSSPPPGSGLTFQKRTDFGPPPPHTPRLASLRFAYTYTQAQAFGWLSWYIL